jgi:phosphatidylglycerophosphate synthase
MNILGLWEGIYKKFTAFRKNLMDSVGKKLNLKSINPDYITVASLIVSFFLLFLLLLPKVSLLAVETLLLSIVLFDALDGAAARAQGINNPEKDVAADRFSELLITSALVNRDYPYSLLLLFLTIVNIFLPYKFIPILPLRIVFIVYFLILWQEGYIPLL